MEAKTKLDDTETMFFKKLKAFCEEPKSRRAFIVRSQIARLLTAFRFGPKFIAFGGKCRIHKPLYITPEFIRIGRGVKIWHHARIEGVRSYAGEHFYPEIYIHNDVEIQQRVHITAASLLEVGEGTSILPDVLITDIDHGFGDEHTKPGEKGIKVSPVKIGPYCTIGAGAKLLAGTKLGAGCVVGANAVVRGEYEDGALVVGVPAHQKTPKQSAS